MLSAASKLLWNIIVRIQQGEIKWEYFPNFQFYLAEFLLLYLIMIPRLTIYTILSKLLKGGIALSLEKENSSLFHNDLSSSYEFTQKTFAVHFEIALGVANFGDYFAVVDAGSAVLDALLALFQGRPWRRDLLEEKRPWIEGKRPLLLGRLAFL